MYTYIVFLCTFSAIEFDIHATVRLYSERCSYRIEINCAYTGMRIFYLQMQLYSRRFKLYSRRSFRFVKKKKNKKCKHISESIRKYRKCQIILARNRCSSKCDVIRLYAVVGCIRSDCDALKYIPFSSASYKTPILKRKRERASWKTNCKPFRHLVTTVTTAAEAEVAAEATR